MNWSQKSHIYSMRKDIIEAAYMISDLEDEDIRPLINSINRNPEQKIDLDLLKIFGKTNKAQRRCCNHLSDNITGYPGGS